MQERPDTDLTDILEAVKELHAKDGISSVLEPIEEFGNSMFEQPDIFILRNLGDGTLQGFYHGQEVRVPVECLNRGKPAAIGEPFLSSCFPEAENAYLVPFSDSQKSLLGAMAFIDVPESLDLDSSDGVASLSALAALAVSRTYLTRESAQAKSEMGYAWSVVKSLLPSKIMEWNGFEFAGLLIPAKKVGGDFYDYFPIDSARMAFIVADATGKGTGPCIQVATCRAYFRALAMSAEHDLGEIARTLNRLMEEDLAADKFVTACFGWLDWETQQLTYVNAGHGSGFFRDEQSVRPIADADPPLGVFENTNFLVHQLSFENCDLVAVFTDGWTERLTSQGEEYGDSRIIQSLEKERTLGSRATLRAAFQAYETACLGSPQADDITALLVRKV